MANQDPIASLPISNYFSHLALNYARDTGNTTFSIFTQLLVNHVQTSSNPISHESVIHDSAAGPGTATAALLTSLSAEQVPSEILVSDNNPAMITGARDSFTSSSQVTCKELDVHDLSSLSDGYFSHSITNFSIFTFPKPVVAVKEIHRTLHLGGLAIITCWRRFAVLNLVHAAQARIRPSGALMPVPGPQFFQDGVLESVVEEAGFLKSKIEVLRKDLLVKDEESVKGLKGFLVGPFTNRAREGYTDDEKARWNEVIDEVVKEEIEKFGGISFQYFAVLATK